MKRHNPAIVIEPQEALTAVYQIDSLYESSDDYCSVKLKLGKYSSSTADFRVPKALFDTLEINQRVTLTFSPWIAATAAMVSEPDEIRVDG